MIDEKCQLKPLVLVAKAIDAKCPLSCGSGQKLCASKTVQKALLVVMGFDSPGLSAPVKRLRVFVALKRGTPSSRAVWAGALCRSLSED